MWHATAKMKLYNEITHTHARTHAQRSYKRQHNNADEHFKMCIGGHVLHKTMYVTVVHTCMIRIIRAYVTYFRQFDFKINHCVHFASWCSVITTERSGDTYDERSVCLQLIGVFRVDEVVSRRQTKVWPGQTKKRHNDGNYSVVNYVHDNNICVLHNMLLIRSLQLISYERMRICKGRLIDRRGLNKEPDTAVPDAFVIK